MRIEQKKTISGADINADHTRGLNRGAQIPSTMQSEMAWIKFSILVCLCISYFYSKKFFLGGFWYSLK